MEAKGNYIPAGSMSAAGKQACSNTGTRKAGGWVALVLSTGQDTDFTLWCAGMALILMALILTCVRYLDRLFPGADLWTTKQRVVWGGAWVLNVFGIIAGLLSIGFYLSRTRH